MRGACLTNEGELFIWGNKLNHEPLQVLLQDENENPMKVSKVVCGGSPRQHCIAIITEDGKLWTMGEGESHMLGRKEVDMKNNTFELVDTFGTKRVLDIEVGLGNHVLAIVEEVV